MLNEKVAKHIRYYRTTQKLTLYDLSKLSRIDPTYLGRIERNEVNMTLNTLEKVLTGLNIQPNIFFNGIDLNSDEQ